MIDPKALALERLQSEERDLRHYDFTGADIRGLVKPGRDFTGANLGQVKAQNANLSGSIFPREYGKLDRANFTDAVLTGAHFENVRLTKVDFTRADLTGAHFENALIDAFTKFDDVIVDENTRFDGTKLPNRNLSHLPAFRFYEFADEHLKRKQEKPATSEPSDVPTSALTLPSIAGGGGRVEPVTASLTIAVVPPEGRRTYPELERHLEQGAKDLATAHAQITTLKAELAALVADENRFGPSGNHPPEPIDLEETARDIEVAAAGARLLRVRLGDGLPSLGADLVTVCYESLKRAWRAVVRFGEWLGGRVDKFSDAFAVSAGTSLGKTAGPAAVLVLLQQLGPNLSELLKMLEPILKLLGLG